MSGSPVEKSPHEEALDPYLFYVEKTTHGNWAVKSSQRTRPLTIVQDKLSATTVVSTLNAEYSSLYDKGWERGYDVGYELAEQQVMRNEREAYEGYQPSDAVELGDPPGDE